MRLVFIAIFALISGFSHSQNSDYNYKFTVKGAEDTVLYLANYYGERLYYADTATTNNKGEAIFTGSYPLEQGKYALVAPGPKYFELIIADNEEIEITTDTTDFLMNMNVIKSENNRIMFDYVKFINEKKNERDLLAAELEENEAKEKKSAAVKAKYNKLNEEVKAYQLNILEEHPAKFISQEIKMSIDVEPPAELQEDKQKAYYWYRDHFWDNVNLKDERIVRTPVFAKKLNTYLGTVLLQNPDTLIQGIDRMMEKVETGSEVYKYVVHYSTYYFDSSKIMGMDEGFVHMVENYYNDNKAFWVDEDKLTEMREKAEKAKPVLIGKKSPELILMDTAGTWIDLYKDVNTDYTVLFFYDPDCGHCKKETPKLVEFYQEYKDKGVSVYAVSSEHDEKWLDFIVDNNMSFYNLSIPKRAFEDAEYATQLIIDKTTTYGSLRYQETFDIFSTPKVFVLDKNKTILAKDIGVERLAELIDMFKKTESEGAKAN